jgi:CHAT domain-containing protein/tetratricopeptide (TPR) repeat protein
VSARIESHDAVLTSDDADWAKALAARLVASGDSPPEPLSSDQTLALAWALKDCAITAWSSDPPAVARTAQLLDTLVPDADRATIAPYNTELSAIGAWVNGIADLTLGRMTEAIARLDEATALFRRLGQSAHAAHAQVPKIMALSMLGRHDAATASGSETLRELVELGETQAAGKVSLNLGNLHCHREEYVESIPYFRRAQDFFEETDDPQAMVMSEIGLANAYASTGAFDQALEVYSSAQRSATQHGILVLEAMVKEHVALVDLARGNFREALAGLEDSRRCYELLANPQQLAIAEKQLGDAYLELRLLPESLSLFDQAIRHFEALTLPVERAWTLAQRGRALAALARPTEEIADCLRQAWELFCQQDATAGKATVLLARAELALTGASPESAVLLAGDAADAFASGSLALGQAQANLVRASALLQCSELDVSAALFASTLVQARAMQFLSIDVRCQVGLGLIAIARGDRKAGEAAFESAITASEDLRRALPGDEIRHAFLVDHLRPYEEMLRITLESADETRAHDAARRVLRQLERFRARSLGERLGAPRSYFAASLLDAREQNSRARLSWLYRRAQMLFDDGEDPQSMVAETRKTELELLEHSRRRRFTSDFDLFAGDSIAFEPTALQMALGQSEVLIEYGVVDDELFSCVVTRERIALQRRMANWSDVLEAIRAARFQIETLRYGTGAVDRHIELLTRRSKAAMQRLHALLWAPVQPLLGGRDKALVVPHDQLGSIQFAALHDGEKYLAETINVAVAASARVALYGLTHQPVSATRALVLGESSRLVHATEEANFVAGLFDHATVLTGVTADAASFSASCTEADIIHLACHAEFRSDNPMFSALQLVDGPFTAQDAESLQLRQGIVVLSACETGVAAYSRGDEMIGLVRAFLLAGSARVVASLWPVDDAITMQFMAVFYRSVRRGTSASHALRAAQLEIMKSHPHPFHWAAFVLHGGW